MYGASKGALQGCLRLEGVRLLGKGLGSHLQGTRQGGDRRPGGEEVHEASGGRAS